MVAALHNFLSIANEVQNHELWWAWLKRFVYFKSRLACSWGKRYMHVKAGHGHTCQCMSKARWYTLCSCCTFCANLLLLWPVACGKQASEQASQQTWWCRQAKTLNPTSSLHTLQGSVSGIQMVMASSLILGCGFASTTLWWFSQRYIGELSLMGPHLLHFSVLDFWGNRQVIISDSPLEHRHDNSKCTWTDTIFVWLKAGWMHLLIEWWLERIELKWFALALAVNILIVDMRCCWRGFDLHA